VFFLLPFFHIRLLFLSFLFFPIGLGWPEFLSLFFLYSSFFLSSRARLGFFILTPSCMKMHLSHLMWNICWKYQAYKCCFQPLSLVAKKSLRCFELVVVGLGMCYECILLEMGVKRIQVIFELELRSISLVCT